MLIFRDVHYLFSHDQKFLKSKTEHGLSIQFLTHEYVQISKNSVTQHMHVLMLVKDHCQD